MNFLSPTYSLNDGLNPTVRLTIFIVSCVLGGALLLYLFLSPLIKSYLYKHFTLKMYYKKIKKVVYDHDFYLINKWSLEMGEGDQGVHIDHLIFGEKYIYVIKDRYYEGALSAKADDKSWVYYFSPKKKKYIDNPLILNHIRADRLSLSSGLDRSYFISVTLINDDCFLPPFKNESKTDYLIPLSKLGKFIDAREKDDVHSFSPKELSAAVNELSELNQHAE